MLLCGLLPFPLPNFNENWDAEVWLSKRDGEAVKAKREKRERGRQIQATIKDNETDERILNGYKWKVKEKLEVKYSPVVTWISVEWFVSTWDLGEDENWEANQSVSPKTLFDLKLTELLEDEDAVLCETLPDVIEAHEKLHDDDEEIKAEIDWKKRFLD